MRFLKLFFFGRFFGGWLRRLLGEVFGEGVLVRFLKKGFWDVFGECDCGGSWGGFW